jgi:DNA-binding CsgD family transcriptional regulator
MAVGHLGRLVGRDDELTVVRDALAAAIGGEARVVGLAGPAGIGKSRLGQECLRDAEHQGFTPLHGAGAALQRDLAYAPIVEALRPLVRDPALVHGLPDLGSLFAELSAPAAPRLAGTGLERVRLFESVCRLLERAAGRHPLALLVDDLHWVDRDSLALLQYLVRGLAGHRLLVVLGYRDDEADPSVHELLDGLRRAGPFTELRLTGLPPPAVRSLARDLMGGEVSPGLAEMLAQRSGGFPLFVGALVDSLTGSTALRCEDGQWVLAPDAAESVPAVVSELLRARVEELPEPAREVLDLVAVCGPAAEHGLLRRIVPEERLLPGLVTLRAARVVTEEVVDGSVVYRTAHPLIAEVAYGLLPLVARRRWHAEVAAALRGGSPPRLGLLAQHLRLAGDEVDRAEALEVLRAAADEALDRKAGDEALVHLGAARELATGSGRDDLLPELLDRTAKAHELTGDRARMVAAWVESADGHPPGLPRAERLHRAATVEWEAGRITDYDQLLSRAESELAGVEPGPAKSLLTATRGWIMMRTGDTVGRQAWIAELDRLHEQTGSAESRRVALGARCDGALVSGCYLEGRRLWADGVELLTVLADEMAEAALRPAFFLELQWGDLPTARARGEEGMAIARRIGVRPLERSPRMHLALSAFFGGDWEEALRGAAALIELGLRTDVPRAVAAGWTARGLVEVRRGAYDRARAAAEEARAAQGPHTEGDRHLLGLVEPIEAALALGRADPDTAVRIATESLSRGNGTGQPLIRSLLAEAHLARDDRKAAAAAADELAGLGPGAPYPGALATWLRGRVHDDPELLCEGAERLGALGFRYEAAVAALDLAAATGTVPSDDCTRALEHLGARPQLDRAAQLARRLGHRPPPPRPGGGALSAREQEVARLVAEGLSNAEIAARLYLSTRTVTTHLHNVYRRLGVGSRAALTRYVLENRPPDT